MDRPARVLPPGRAVVEISADEYFFDLHAPPVLRFEARALNSTVTLALVPEHIRRTVENNLAERDASGV